MVVPESINNIMGGLESTGGVTLHNHRRKLKQRFETISKLGQGTYGKVQLGVNKETGQEVAIKTIKKCKIETEADLIRIRREIQIMSSLRHPYIIHIYEVFENRDKMVLVMEYAAGGELYDYLTKQKVLDETEARRIFRQIAMAVFYCHKHQICHRDLKLENILLDEQGNAKIADFGLSNVFESSRLLSTFCGSPLYASPEIVLGIPYHGPEVDCWSLGVLLYTLVYGAMPFDGSNFKRLVRQISAGDYFEPKVPSSASDLIHGLLTVSKDERLNITAVCQHAWMNEEGIVSCHRLAVELAQEEPNRLDLLLALAPSNEQVPSVPEESATVPTAPVRSQSLSSLGCVQPSATFTAVTSETQPPSEEKKKADSEKRRERSRSRSRKMDGDEGKTRKRSTKSKKKSDSELPPKEEVEKVLELAAKVNQNLSAEDSSPSSLTEPVSFESSVELPPSCESNTEASPMKSTESESTPLEIQLTTETSDVVEEVKSETSTAPTFSEEPLQPQLPPPEVIDEAPVSVKKEKKPEVTIATEKSSTKIKSPSTKSVATLPNQTEGADVKRQPQIKARRSVDKIPSNNKEAPVLRQDSVRRKSKVFETAELFSKSPSTDKAGTKKVVIPGVKVSDAKAAFERRSSLSQSPTTDKKPDFSLASTVGLNKLVMNELNKEKQIDIDANVVPSPAPREIVKETEEEKTKKENAVKVISHAISESEMNVKKASTLPRRKLSRSSISNQEEPVPVPVSPVSSPSAPKVVPPVPAPRPYVVRKASGPREHIIPIKIEERTVPNQPERSERAQSERPRPSSRQASISSSVASSSSFGRQDSDSSTLLGSTISPSEPIRKSPREVIIPIAVEGGGYVTPSQSTLSKMSSVSESEEDLPMRGFGLHSTRRRHPQLETADSVSSDEDDGDFEAISTENLFQTLLARMRNLTQRLDEGRPTFPRMFSPMFEPRRLMETKSFDMEPSWRRKSGITSTSSSTLPRGFTAKSLRRALSRDEPKTDTTDLPPTPQRKVTRTTSDSLHNGFHSGRRYGTSRRQESSENETATTALDHLLKNGRLSSLERVKKYLEDIQNEGINNEEAPKMRESSERLSTKYWRPRSVYIPEMTETSEFDKYMDFKHSLNSFSGFNTNRRPSNAYDRIKELHEYRRSVSEMAKSCQNENEKLEMDNETVPEKKKEEILPVETDDAPVNKSTILNKYLDEQQKPKKESRFLSKVRNSKKEESRVDKTIKALRHRSVGIENEFSESKLLKRAVSLEDLSAESVDGRTRASSLTPESAFERRNSSVKLKKGGIFDQIRQSATTTTTADEEGRRKEKEERFARISNLKKFDNFPKLDQLSTESTPTGDFDEAQSCLSQTDNSDTWSGSDYNERYFDAGAPTSTPGEDNVGERIRRKSFFHRFNAPKRYSYQRSASNVEKKRYF